jgi:glycerol kinase
VIPPSVSSFYKTIISYYGSYALKLCNKVGVQNLWGLFLPQKINREFIPNMDEKIKERLYSGWKKPIKRSLNWEKWEKEE